MDKFEDVAVVSKRWSMDLSTLYIDLITGENVELHGKTIEHTTTVIERNQHVRRTVHRFVLHNEEGPSRISRRGHRVHRSWYLEGRRMSKESWKKILTRNVTMDDIVQERNTEIRMLLVKALGVDRIVEFATKINESVDECKRPRILWEYLVRKEDDTRSWIPSVRIRFVEVYNSSPPYERFLLYVPPEITTADEAVKWTFPGLPEGFDYDPDVSS